MTPLNLPYISTKMLSSEQKPMESSIPVESAVNWRCFSTLGVKPVESFSQSFSELPCVIFTPDFVTITDPYDFKNIVWVYFSRRDTTDEIPTFLIAKRKDGVFVHFQKFSKRRRVSYSSSWKDFWNDCLDVDSRKLLTIR